jgi:hypothetical protein
LHPYQGLPPEAFWKRAVASKNRLEIDGLYQPKFRLTPQHRTVTFGSCFAQHIARALRERSFGWVNAEPAPYKMSESDAIRFNFGVFSCRTGNIYTTSLLKQWTTWALDPTSVPDEVWEHDGRFYDPFRPNVEPNGFVSIDEMRRSRSESVRAFRACIEQGNNFVFTLGLTESWVHKDGYEYPMCPGTVEGGTFDPDKHRFVNQTYPQVRRSLVEAMELMKGINKRLRFILTVSPVPLTATNSGKHVLIATMQSKSVLRAVAGQIADSHEDVDYFPSYEIINSPVFGGVFFDPNQRTIAEPGVAFVMESFFRAHEDRADKTAPRKRKANRNAVLLKRRPKKKAASRKRRKGQSDEVCEERLLEAFA